MNSPLDIAREIWGRCPQTEWAAELAKIPERRGEVHLRHAVRECLLVVRHWKQEGDTVISTTIPKVPDNSAMCAHGRKK